MSNQMDTLNERAKKKLRKEMYSDAIDDLTEALTEINNAMQVFHHGLRKLRMVVEVTND